MWTENDSVVQEESVPTRMKKIPRTLCLLSVSHIHPRHQTRNGVDKNNWDLNMRDELTFFVCLLTFSTISHYHYNIHLYLCNKIHCSPFYHVMLQTSFSLKVVGLIFCYLRILVLTSRSKKKKKKQLINFEQRIFFIRILFPSPDLIKRPELRILLSRITATNSGITFK